MEPGAHIPPEFVEAVLDHTDLAAVAARYCDLQPRGGEWWACCPFHWERTPSFHVLRDGRHWKCFGGCGDGGDSISFLQRADGIGFPEAVKRLAAECGLADGEGLLPIDLAEREQRRAERKALNEAAEKKAAADLQRALEIWSDAVPIDGTPAEIYLRDHRVINPALLLSDPPGWPGSLGFSTDALRLPGKPALIALVVAVTSGKTGTVRGVQRIRLHPDGRPIIGADGKKVKRSLGEIVGGSARFGPFADPAGRWGCAEGPETALASVQLFGFPVWSAINSGNMPGVVPPQWARHVTAFADNDPGSQGLSAAGAAAQRWRTLPHIETARVVIATAVKDMADIVKGTAHG